MSPPGFLSSFDHRHSLVGHPVPAEEFRSPHGRPTRQPAPGPDGVSTFHTSELRPDWLPSLPRDPTVLSRPVRSLRSPFAPSARGQALSPRCSSHLRSCRLRGVIKGSLAFSRPAFPLAWLIPWMEAGALGHTPRASHPYRQDLRRTPGRGTGIEHSPGAT